MSVAGVRLPTGYYLGLSAATGDLSGIPSNFFLISFLDNHDVLSVKMFEQEYQRVEKEKEINRQNIEPSADFIAAPRDHVDTPKPSKLGWIGTVLLVIIGIVVVVLVLGFGFAYMQNRSERSRKRFY
jgi:lectin, mannose-binding 2